MKQLSEKDNLERILPQLPLPLTGFGSLSENYKKIEKIFETRSDFPDYESIYSEICTCLTFGLNQASITLTNHLLEKSLLIALIYHEAFVNKDSKSHLDFNNYFVVEIEKYNNFTLELKIDYCFEKQLISLEQKKELHEFRKNIRNGFSHSNLKKIFGNLNIDSQIISFEVNDIKVEEIKMDLWKSIFTQGLTQAAISEKIAANYFIYIDSIIRQLYNEIFKK